VVSETPSVESLQGEVTRLRRAVDELSVLNDLVVEIGGSKDSGQIVEAILRKALEAIGAEQGVITLIDHGSDDTLHTLMRAGGASAEHPPYHFSESLLGWMQIHQQPLCVNQPGSDDRFQGVRWEPSIRSLASVPMTVRSQLRSTLTLYNKIEDEGFTQVDMRLLAILATQSTQVFESARLREQEMRLLKLREELELAATIQARLLPVELPKLEGYEIAATMHPAEAVGGDYYDVLAPAPDRLCLCVGDVSGKGIPAALLMANLQATIRGQTCLQESCAGCIERSNQFMYQSTALNKFATLFYGRLDASQHELRFCNAGHNPPLLFSGEGEPRRLESGNGVLGLFDDLRFSEETVPLQQGDLLAIYSDGVTEAANTLDEQFGESRLIEVLQSHRHAPATELLQRVLDVVRGHAGEQEQSDDITLMILKRAGTGA